MTALQHFGIKGMKWGVRRAEKAQARFDKNVKEGMTPSQAQEAEVERRKKIRRLTAVGITAALLYAPTILAYGQAGTQSIGKRYVDKKATQAGAKAAANLLADSRGLSSYKIVDLGFDAASGSWR